MTADGLTKMGTAQVLDDLRKAMDADIPPIPSDDMTVKGGDDSWWACAVINLDIQPIRCNEYYFQKLQQLQSGVTEQVWTNAKTI